MRKHQRVAARRDSHDASTGRPPRVHTTAERRALGSVADTLVVDVFDDLECCVNEGVPAGSRLEAAHEETLRAAGYLDDDSGEDEDGSDAAVVEAADEDDSAGGSDVGSGGLMDSLSREDCRTRPRSRVPQLTSVRFV